MGLDYRRSAGRGARCRAAQAHPDRAGSAAAVPGNRRGPEMMNLLLCSPNGGFPLVGLGVGIIATIIWMAVDPRFRKYPDDPLRRSINLQLTNLIVILGGGTGFIVGLVLSQFISFRC